MSDTTVTTVAPTTITSPAAPAAPVTPVATTVVSPADTTAASAPVITAASFHPDHPGPIGWLIYSLHARLSVIEHEMGINTVSTEPKTVPPATTATPAAPSTGFVATVESDAESAIHKLEDVLHIKHS